MKTRLLALIISIASIATNLNAGITSRGLDANAYTSDFMIGKVVVSVIFTESNGTQDQNTETWSEERKTQALSQIMQGLDWWTKQNSRSPLSFTYLSQTVSTKYEPINRPYYDEALWIPDVMSKLGYSGTRFTATRNYINALRTQHKTDWGFVVFVVDSLNDSNGKFADGLFAYSYLGGPFVVMTYDNNGYGIGNMSVVMAHEMGHVFHALDEYAGASGPNDYSTGYFPTINGNHVYSTSANEPNSIMRGGLRWGLNNWARQAIGWRDSDNNNKDDILDQNPTATLNQMTTQAGGTSFSGQASIAVLPRQGNAQGYGLTLDTISKVEYRLANGSWANASPSDGTFDSGDENFSIVISAGNQGIQNVTAKDVQVRVTTAFAALSGGGGSSPTTSSGGGTPTDLSSAHAFPNPFKPNSELGHTTVTFTDLTPGAKVQIFNVAGEPIFNKEAPSGATTLTWDAINDDGQKVVSGVYYFLITDTAGHKKDGKVAVIR